MTLAGIKCRAYGGVGKDDARYKKAMEWVSKNYSVDTNPGMPAGGGRRAYFYYLMTMAWALDAAGVREITDAAGKKHDWRADIRAALAFRQRRDGSWSGSERWMES